MKKWILIGGGLAALLVGAAVALLITINPVVEAGVNLYGPDITGTHVFLKKADISVFSGKGSLHEFTLGNPRGYSSPHAVKVGAVSMELDKGTLMGDVVVIRKIDIDSPDIVYEIGKDSNNFDDILANVRQSVGALEKSAKSSDSSSKGEGAGKKVVIDELTIRNASAAIAMPLLKLNITAPLPDIRLTDIGREKGRQHEGVTMAEAAERVLKELSGSLGTASRNAAGQARVKLKASGDALRKGAKDATDKLKQGLGGLFGK